MVRETFALEVAKDCSSELFEKMAGLPLIEMGAPFDG